MINWGTQPENCSLSTFENIGSMLSYTIHLCSKHKPLNLELWHVCLILIMFCVGLCIQKKKEFKQLQEHTPCIRLSPTFIPVITGEV